MKETNTMLVFLLPEEVNGWQACEQDAYYSSDNLHEYINGGAELYRSYGFKSSINRIYCREEQPDIIVDIFDMTSSENAFGVFMHGREEIDDQFGQGSEYASGMLLFWKNKYFISLLASPETKTSKPALFKLAGKIEDAIGQDGPQPEILKLLPRQNLVQNSVRFFQHHVWLNSFFFISDENILNINENNRALSAKYIYSGDPTIFLIVRYSDEESAEIAQKNFSLHYLQKENSLIEQLEDGKWTACKKYENLLVLVFNSEKPEYAEMIFQSFENKLNH